MGSVKDLQVGQKIGRWTILELGVYNPESKAKKKTPMALCQCECGTIRYKEYRALYDKRSLSCGCLRREQVIQRNYEKGNIDIGTRFGKLTYIKDLGYRKQLRDKQERWGLCQCDCGSLIEVSHNNLRTGGTQSCGCISSRGESIIANILSSNNINFVKQYSFKDLRGVGNGLLRFDFAILDDDNKIIKLIEFDGRQHFSGPDTTWNKGNSLEYIQENDSRKNQYCKEHGIPLLRIPYYDIGKIDLEYLDLIRH